MLVHGLGLPSATSILASRHPSLSLLIISWLGNSGALQTAGCWLWTSWFESHISADPTEKMRGDICLLPPSWFPLMSDS